VSGTATAACDAGQVVELRAVDLFHIPPEPHDSWVVGDQRYVSIHFLGADSYARWRFRCSPPVLWPHAKPACGPAALNSPAIADTRTRSAGAQNSAVRARTTTAVGDTECRARTTADPAPPPRPNGIDVLVQRSRDHAGGGNRAYSRFRRSAMSKAMSRKR
jgi:hypothetical protein